MTDVVVHHMHAEKRVRIKSRDYAEGGYLQIDYINPGPN